jgi:hypothetical protein
VTASNVLGRSTDCILLAGVVSLVQYVACGRWVSGVPGMHQSDAPELRCWPIAGKSVDLNTENHGKRWLQLWLGSLNFVKIKRFVKGVSLQ